MKYLSPTYYLDFRSEAVQQLIKEFKPIESKKEIAIALYLKIRDGWRYNPYRISFVKEAYRASVIAQKREGHCIEKAILLVACLRALNIPARLQLARVKNHIGVARLIAKFGTNELTPHGMACMYLEGRWLKAAPAFNRELCARYNVGVMEFDGEHDSVFQEFDHAGNTFMEYLQDYGTFDDVPIDFIFRNFQDNYPEIYKQYKGQQEFLL